MSRNFLSWVNAELVENLRQNLLLFGDADDGNMEEPHQFGRLFKDAFKSGQIFPVLLQLGHAFLLPQGEKRLAYRCATMSPFN